MNIGQDPKEFAYVRFAGQYYPTSMVATYKEVVLAKDYVWVRDAPIGVFGGGVGYPLTKSKRDKTKDIPFN